MDTFSTFSTINLTEISFIAGTYRELAFDVYNASGSPINLNTLSSCQWVLSPFGRPDVTVLSKSGTIDSVTANRFWIYLYSSDTASLTGKYVQQPVVIVSTDHEYRVGQGYINIIPASGFSTAEEAQSISQQLIGMSASMIAFEADVSGSISSFETDVSGSISSFKSSVSGSITTFESEVSGSIAGYENRKVVSIPLNTISALSGTEVNYISIPAIMNGWYLYDARASCSGSSTSGSPTFTVSRTSASTMNFTSMLSTVISIDEGEFDSSTATSQRVISTSASSVFTGYKVRVTSGSSAYGTNVTYAQVSLTFAK